MVQRVEAKELAKKQLKGNWGGVIVAYLVIGLVELAVSFLSRVPLLGIVLSVALMGMLPFGTAFYALKFTTTGGAEVEDMFAAFKKDNYGKSLVLALLVGIFTALWSLLLIVPGIIKAYSYSMAFYIMADHPEMTASEALDKSKEITQGNKWDLFVTDLSFIGWSLLASLTLGIGYLWLIPYINTTRANIYAQIKEKEMTIEASESIQ